MSKKTDQLKAGALLSYVQMGLGVIVQLLFTPLMIRALGQNEYGLYNTVSSTISLLSVLSLGFNAGYIRYYTVYKKNNDKDAIYRLNGLFLIIFIIIGIVSLICGLFLSFNLDLVFDTGLTASEYQTARILMILLTVNLAVSFPMSVFANIISAHERYVFLKVLGIVKNVFGPLISMPLLLLGFRSVSLVVVTLIVSVIVDALYFGYVIFVLKNKFVFHDFEKGLFKQLIVYTSFIAMNLIVDQINLNIDKLLLGRFIGTASVAIYSVAYSLYQYYMMFSVSVSNVFTPRIHRIIRETEGEALRRRQALTELFTKVGRIQLLILGLVTSGIVFFGKPFIYYWAGTGYEEAYYVALLLIIPALIPLTQNLGIEIQRAENNHQFRSIVYLIMALLNLVLSIFLCQKYGAIGSAVGTAISLIIANGFIMNVYYHKRCYIDMIAFWKSILKIFPGFISPVLFGLVLTRYIDMYSIWNLLISILCYSIVYCASVWLMSMSAYEKNLLMKPIKKVLKR